METLHFPHRHTFLPTAPWQGAENQLVPLQDDTDRLLRDFLLGEERRQKKIDEKVQSGASSVVRALQEFSQEIRARIDTLESKVDKADAKADKAYARADEGVRLAMHSHDRLDAIGDRERTGGAHLKMHTKAIYDLGTDSPTGSHFIVSKEVLEEIDREQSAKKWHAAVGWTAKVGGAALGAVLSAYIILHVLGKVP